MQEHIEYFEKVIQGCNRSILQERNRKGGAQRITDLITKREHYQAAVIALKNMEDDGK